MFDYLRLFPSKGRIGLECHNSSRIEVLCQGHCYSSIVGSHVHNPRGLGSGIGWPQRLGAALYSETMMKTLVIILWLYISLVPLVNSNCTTSTTSYCDFPMWQIDVTIVTLVTICNYELSWQYCENMAFLNFLDATRKFLMPNLSGQLLTWCAFADLACNYHPFRTREWAAAGLLIL